PLLSRAPHTTALHPLSLHDALPIFTRASARTCKRKRALTRKTIEHASAARILRNNSVIILLIEIKPGLLSVQKIDIKPYIVDIRSEEHTSELQSRFDLVCRLLLEKK